MKVKMILPALTEATSPFWRPIKYSLFPPLGLATLAAYLGDDADVEIQDEHVEPLTLNDTPDLVVIQVYITSAHRAYRLADHYRGRGASVALGTALYRRMWDQGRLTTHDWDLYDTRHAVFRPARMSAEQLECGYRWAYREFYRWRSIARGASAHDDLLAGLRHLAYAAGWKKFEPLWDVVIRAKRAGTMLPVLETILSEFGRRSPRSATRDPFKQSARPHRRDPLYGTRTRCSGQA
jgi:hypothetical protein